MQQKTPYPQQVIIAGKSYSIDDAYALAVQYAGQKNSAESAAILRQLLQVERNHAPSLNALGVLLFDDHLDEAISLFRRSIQHHPKHAIAYNNLGYAWITKGQMDEAEKMLLKAVELNPASTQALYNLTLIRKYTLDHKVVKHMQLLAERYGDKLPSAEHLYYGLGKVYDDNRCYDKAFAHYRKANEIRGKAVDFNPRACYQYAAGVAQVFTDSFLAQPALGPATEKGPIFIVGMPRSGTTLLANILSGHPAIHAAGELPTLLQQAINLPTLIGVDVGYPEAVRHLTKEAAATIIATYQQRLWQGVGEEATYVIDKHPINFRYLGLIHMLFPNAKIFHCTREPLDTCLSNYFQCFLPEYSYSFDLLNIGHFYNGYQQLMQHWQQALPQKVMDVSYEMMVEDTETVARQALAYLGLPWNERCLSPHKNARVVKTSSMWQVRQPVYRKSLARWRHYEKHLGELKALLGEGMF